MKICEKFKRFCNNSSFLKYILIISIILQTYMIGRSFFLMIKIDHMIDLLDLRINNLKNINEIIMDFENILDKYYKRSFNKLSPYEKKDFCADIKKYNDKYFNYYFDNNYDYENFKKEIIAMTNNLYDKCKYDNIVLSLDNKQQIYNTVKNIKDIKVKDYYYLMQYDNKLTFLNNLKFWLRYLVIISAFISVIIYILIIISFLVLRRINFDLKNKVDEIIKLKKGLDEAAVPIIITNIEGNIEYVNKEFEIVYGYSFEEALGKNPRIIKGGKTSQDLYANLWGTIKSGKKWVGKFNNKSKDGDEVIVEAYINPIVDSDGRITHFIGIHRNITLQTKLMNDLVLAKQQADEANRAKSDFLSSMSHEIRTPLNAIVGMADLLKDTSLNDEQKKYIDILHNATDGLLSIVNDILDISKIESGKIELESMVFNLEKLAYDISEIISIKASSKNIEVICRIKPDVPVNLVGDPTKLRQIIINLMGNSVKFVEKGWILLEISKKEEKEDSVILNISVSDTGIGIPSDKLDKIFDKFSQAEISTTRKYGGTGLGLAISKMLVEIMGGRISVSSEVGKGTKFDLEIPFKKTKTVAAEKKYYDLTALKGLNIMVVDDNDINRIIFKEILSPLGPNIETFSSSALAFDNLKFKKYDILILDYNMPEMDGYELVKKIMISSDIKLKPKILMTTSDLLKFKKNELKELNVDNFLAKPIKKGVLIDTLLYMIGERKEEEKKTESEKNFSKSDLPKLKILIVDDSEDNRMLMSSYVKGSQIVCDMAENGEDAIDMVKRNDYDIIFMDMQMPIMDGMTAVKNIREWEKNYNIKKNKIVALTANVLKEQIDSALKNGFDDYLTKPIRKNTFYSYLIDFVNKKN